MSTKINFTSAAPEVARSLFEAGALLAKSGLEPSLLTLVELRASQINRCAFCLALHMREGQALGESSDRLSGIAAWRDAPWYSERERAALEWTEALTQLAAQHPPSDLLGRMKAHYTEREIVYLTLAVTTINSYNRFNVAFGTSPADADAVFKMLHREAAAAHA
ncbi:MAG: carboxymuconolactone decarboxylase family protein [Candidatus Eremiobacteraeota bacterium]|nr:carboxymuconolactone decarboxylase family protein [Candidatus Eremiobacteraeota bacterium]